MEMRGNSCPLFFPNGRRIITKQRDEKNIPSGPRTICPSGRDISVLGVWKKKKVETEHVIIQLENIT